MSKNTKVSKNPVHEVLNKLIGEFWAGNIRHQTHLSFIKALGVDALAAEMEQRISDEPDSIKVLTDRLLDLDGVPEFAVPALTFAKDVRSILQADLQAQQLGLVVLKRAAEIAAENHDVKTRVIIETILIDEEDHLSWLKSEFSILERLGDQLYFLNRMTGGAAEKTVADAGN